MNPFFTKRLLQNMQNKFFFSAHNMALMKMIFFREFRALYRRTLLGPLLAIFAPLAFIAVFIFFRLLFGLESSDGVPVLLFLFSGLSNWLLFTATLSSTFPALISNVALLKKIPINPLVFVVSGVFLPFVTYCVHFIMLEGMAIYYGYYPNVHHITLPLLAITLMSFAMGLGLLVASLACYRQDIIHLLPIIIQLGMFATPIFFSVSVVPEHLQWAVTINPVAHCITLFREVLFTNSWPNFELWGYTLLSILALWAIALPIFKRTTKYLADIY